MTLQTIKSSNGKIEYVLLPYAVYKALHKSIENELSHLKAVGRSNDYVPFDPADYIDNLVALARLKARITQEELAKKLGVSQAYISKIENQTKVSPKLLARVNEALKPQKKRASSLAEKCSV